MVTILFTRRQGSRDQIHLTPLFLLKNEKFAAILGEEWYADGRRLAAREDGWSGAPAFFEVQIDKKETAGGEGFFQPLGVNQAYANNS